MDIFDAPLFPEFVVDDIVVGSLFARTIAIYKYQFQIIYDLNQPLIEVLESVESDNSLA